MTKAVRALLLGGMVISSIGCNSTGIQTSDSGSFIQTIIGQKLDLSESSSNKLWEGKIEGKQVAYFRSETGDSFKDIVVVTQDRLPNHFRSIEYYDNDGDLDLDLINIRRYREGHGWNDLTITAKNEHTLQHANAQYNELMKKIVALRLKEGKY